MPQSVVAQSSDRNLTEKQEKLLQLFWNSGCTASPLSLAEEAGYTATSIYAAVRNLSKEILKLTEAKLITHAPAAASAITDAITSTVPSPGIKDRLTAATTLLDRVGLGKKETLQVETKGQGGVFLIPVKKELEPIEGDYTEEEL